MAPPKGTKTKQGYELQLGTNNVGHYLFTKLLTPILHETAKTATPGSVRVVWVASSAAEKFSPKGGVDMNNLDYKTDKSSWHKYGVSKAGNILQGKEFATRFGKDGIVSVVRLEQVEILLHILDPEPQSLIMAIMVVQSCDPGNLSTGLYQHIPSWQRAILVRFFLKPAIYGAYTELFCGFSPNISLENNGAFGESTCVFQDARG